MLTSAFQDQVLGTDTVPLLDEERLARSDPSRVLEPEGVSVIGHGSRSEKRVARQS